MIGERIQIIKSRRVNVELIPKNEDEAGGRWLGCRYEARVLLA